MIALLGVNGVRGCLERFVLVPDHGRDDSLIDQRLRNFDEQAVKMDEFLFSHSVLDDVLVS